jgi:hypothetical protein
MMRDNLIAQGVPAEKILMLVPAAGTGEHDRRGGSQVLRLPAGRRAFFERLEAAASPNTSGDAESRSVVCEIPDAPGSEGRETERQTEAGQTGRPGETEDTGGELPEGSRLLVSRTLSFFTDSARELLEAENFEGLEEKALQVKQELERYGFGEMEDLLFKLVLAGRKGDVKKVGRILGDLKRRAAYYKMNT